MVLRLGPIERAPPQKSVRGGADFSAQVNSFHLLSQSLVSKSLLLTVVLVRLLTDGTRSLRLDLFKSFLIKMSYGDPRV